MARTIKPVRLRDSFTRTRPPGLPKASSKKDAAPRERGERVEREEPRTGLLYRVIYGPPKVGVSTVLDILQKASRTPLYVFDDAVAANALDPTLPGVVVIAHFPKTIEEASVVPALGFYVQAAAIRLEADDALLASRGATRERVLAWRRQIEPIEHQLDYLTVPRATVINLDLETTVAEVARRLGLKD